MFLNANIVILLLAVLKVTITVLVQMILTILIAQNNLFEAYLAINKSLVETVSELRYTVTRDYFKQYSIVIAYVIVVVLSPLLSTIYTTYKPITIQPTGSVQIPLNPVHVNRNSGYSGLYPSFSTNISYDVSMILNQTSIGSDYIVRPNDFNAISTTPTGVNNRGRRQGVLSKVNPIVTQSVDRLMEAASGTTAVSPALFVSLAQSCVGLEVRASGIPLFYNRQLDIATPRTAEGDWMTSDTSTVQLWAIDRDAYLVDSQIIVSQADLRDPTPEVRMLLTESKGHMSQMASNINANFTSNLMTSDGAVSFVSCVKGIYGDTRVLCIRNYLKVVRLAIQTNFDSVGQGWPPTVQELFQYELGSIRTRVLRYVSTTQPYTDYAPSTEMFAKQLSVDHKTASLLVGGNTVYVTVFKTSAGYSITWELYTTLAFVGLTIAVIVIARNNPVVCVYLRSASNLLITTAYSGTDACYHGKQRISSALRRARDLDHILVVLNGEVLKTSPEEIPTDSIDAAPGLEKCGSWQSTRSVLDRLSSLHNNFTYVNPDPKPVEPAKPGINGEIDYYIATGLQPEQIFPIVNGKYDQVTVIKAWREYGFSELVLLMDGYSASDIDRYYYGIAVEQECQPVTSIDTYTDLMPPALPTGNRDDDIVMMASATQLNGLIQIEIDPEVGEISHVRCHTDRDAGALHNLAKIHVDTGSKPLVGKAALKGLVVKLLQIEHCVANGGNGHVINAQCDIPMAVAETQEVIPNLIVKVTSLIRDGILGCDVCVRSLGSASMCSVIIENGVETGLTSVENAEHATIAEPGGEGLSGMLESTGLSGEELSLPNSNERVDDTAAGAFSESTYEVNDRLPLITGGGRQGDWFASVSPDQNRPDKACDLTPAFPTSDEAVIRANGFNKNVHHPRKTHCDSESDMGDMIAAPTTQLKQNPADCANGIRRKPLAAPRGGDIKRSHERDDLSESDAGAATGAPTAQLEKNPVDCANGVRRKPLATYRSRGIKRGCEREDRVSSEPPHPRGAEYSCWADRRRLSVLKKNLERQNIITSGCKFVRQTSSYTRDGCNNERRGNGLNLRPSNTHQVSRFVHENRFEVLSNIEEARCERYTADLPTKAGQLVFKRQRKSAQVRNPLKCERREGKIRNDNTKAKVDNCKGPKRSKAKSRSLGPPTPTQNKRCRLYTYPSDVARRVNTPIDDRDFNKGTGGTLQSLSKAHRCNGFTQRRYTCYRRKR